MRSRGILLCIPVIAYLACALFGLHSHVDVDHGHSAVPHVSHTTHFESALSSAHLAEHLTDDDIDVDDRGMVAAKISLPTFFFIAVFFLIQIQTFVDRRSRVLRTAETPLRPPRRTYLLPPSQAPPVSA